MTLVPWFAGLTVDHLFENCPNRTRAEKSLRRYGLWWNGEGGIDPHGDFVCGMCVRRYDRGQRSAVAASSVNKPESSDVLSVLGQVTT